MRRPRPFTRPSSFPSPSFQSRYNPIYDEIEAKKADSRREPRSFLPFSLFSSPSQPDHIHDSNTQPPQQSYSPSLCTGAAAPPPSEHSTSSFSPFNEKPSVKSSQPSRAQKSQARREQRAREKQNKTQEKDKRKREKQREKEKQRQRKRNSGLGWAKSWSFGGEHFGGTLLADASGVRVPIFRFRICGWGCAVD